jgi:hypothetical protein
LKARCVGWWSWRAGVLCGVRRDDSGRHVVSASEQLWPHRNEYIRTDKGQGIARGVGHLERPVSKSSWRLGRVGSKRVERQVLVCTPERRHERTVILKGKGVAHLPPSHHAAGRSHPAAIQRGPCPHARLRHVVPPFERTIERPLPKRRPRLPGRRPVQQVHGARCRPVPHPAAPERYRRRNFLHEIRLSRQCLPVGSRPPSWRGYEVTWRTDASDWL